MTGSVLRVDDLPGRGDVTLERHGRILHDADLVARLLEQVIDALPAGPIHESTMYENNSVRRLAHYGLLSGTRVRPRACASLVAVIRR